MAEDDKAPNYRVRILTPHVGVENIEALKDNKPFIMRAELELGAQFIQTAALPTLVDMLGFSGGGGAPAYGFLVEEAQKEKEPVLFISLVPNEPIYLPVITIHHKMEERTLSWDVLGITHAMGALLTHFILKGSGISKILENAESEGAVVVDMIDYKIPEILQQKILPGRLAQVQSQT